MDWSLNLQNNCFKTKEFILEAKGALYYEKLQDNFQVVVKMLKIMPGILVIKQNKSKNVREAVNNIKN